MFTFYKYLFYKLYISLEKYSSPRFWSEWKAASLLVLLLLSIVYSLILYYTIYINRLSSIGGNVYIIGSIAIFLSVINYSIFIFQNKWIVIVEKFNKIPKRRNQIGSLVFLLFCTGCVANIVYAFYLFSQIDWSLY